MVDVDQINPPFARYVSMNHHQGSVPLGSYPAARNSPSPIQILLIWKEELIHKLIDHVFLLPPYFPSNHKPASLGYSLLYHQHQHLSDFDLMTIEVQSKFHGNLFIISLKCSEELKPPGFFESLSHLRVGFKEFGTFWFDSGNLFAPLWHHLN
jgi:hypothetical protein